MPTYQSPGVYVEEVAAGARPLAGVGTAVAAFVGLAESGPFNQPTLISNWTQFSNVFGGFVAGSYLAQSVYGYFMNGGGNCYVVRIGQDPVGNGQGSRSARAKELAAAPAAQIGRLKVTVVDPAVQPNEVSVQITDPGGDNPGTEAFKLVVKRNGQVVEEYDNAQLGKGKQSVVTMVNAASKLISLEETNTGAVERLPNSETALASPPSAAALPTGLGADDYVGDVSDRTGFAGLEAVEEVTMLCVPDLMSAYQQGAIDLDAVQAVQTAMMQLLEPHHLHITTPDLPRMRRCEPHRQLRPDVDAEQPRSLRSRSCPRATRTKQRGPAFDAFRRWLLRRRHPV